MISSVLSQLPLIRTDQTLFLIDTRRCLGSRPAPDASAHQAHMRTLYRLYGIAEWTFKAKPSVDAVMQCGCRFVSEGEASVDICAEGLYFYRESVELQL